MTDYYIIAVDDDGDVLAARAALVVRSGLRMTVETGSNPTIAYENHGDDPLATWEAARDAMAAVMPEENYS